MYNGLKTLIKAILLQYMKYLNIKKKLYCLLLVLNAFTCIYLYIEKVVKTDN